MRMQNKAYKTIGKRIKEARISCNMNQSDLARLLEVSPQSVQHWESGTSLPKSIRIHELAEALDVQPSWLLPNTDVQAYLTDEGLSFEEIMMIRKYRKMDLEKRNILNDIANVLLNRPENSQNTKVPSVKPK